MDAMVGIDPDLTSCTGTVFFRRRGKRRALVVERVGGDRNTCSVYIHDQPHWMTSRVLTPKPRSSTHMAVLSTLRLSKERLALLGSAYSSHRPAIQRVLNAGFILYSIGTTYQAFSAKPPSSGRKEKSKGRENPETDDKPGKPPRVAVRTYLLGNSHNLG